MKPLPFGVRENTELEKWRVDTFWTKEPETIAWIDSFLPGESLLDVGANIGLYSFYAASRGCKVLALEPHPGSYAALSLNMRFNKHCPIRCFPWAVWSSNDMIEFNFSDVFSGSSDGGITKSGKKHDYVAAYKIDWIQLVHGPFDHIKIDIDGEENLAVMGMEQCLKDRSFKSCLIEVDKNNLEIVKYAFQISGYNLDSPLNSQENHSRNRRRAEGINVENLIFYRTPRDQHQILVETGRGCQPVGG